MKIPRQCLAPLVMLAIAILPVGAQEKFAVPTNPAAAVLQAPIAITPREVRWTACSKVLPPGAQCAKLEGDPTAADVLFTQWVKIPDGYRVDPHFHPADEHLTVISGTFNIGHGRKFDMKALKALPPGSFAVMPKGHIHFAVATGETIIQVHAIGPWGLTYTDPGIRPRHP